MGRIKTFKNKIEKSLTNVSFDDPQEKLEKLFSNSSTYESILVKKKFIKDLCTILKNNKDLLAKIEYSETGKPVSEARDEVERTIEFLNELQVHSILDVPNDTLFLNHFTDPIMTTCLAVVFAVTTRSKVLIRTSTKASKTVSRLQSLLPNSIQWDIIFCDQEAVDNYLIKDSRFYKIYVDAYEGIFNKIKDKSAGQEIVGQIYTDQILVIDNSSDVEKFADAFINQFFLYSTRYGVRLNKILVEDTMYKTAVSMFEFRMKLKLEENKKNGLEENFVNNIPQYRVDKVKKILLDSIAEGAELVLGSITDNIDNPVLVTKVKSSMAIFSSPFWAPVILLVPFKKGDFPSIVRSLNENTIFIGNQFTVNWMEEKYYKAATSTILGLNNSPERVWEMLMMRKTL